MISDVLWMQNSIKDFLHIRKRLIFGNDSAGLSSVPSFLLVCSLSLAHNLARCFAMPKKWCVVWGIPSFPFFFYYHFQHPRAANKKNVCILTSSFKKFRYSFLLLYHFLRYFSYIAFWVATFSTFEYFCSDFFFGGESTWHTFGEPRAGRGAHDI